MQDFRHKISLTTRFADVDMLGHVNNAKYVTYLEEARIQYARDVLGWHGEPNVLGMILAKTVIDYLLPLEAGQKVVIYTRCARLGRKSFDLHYAILKSETQQTVSTAVTTMVAYDYMGQTSVIVSDEWRSRILAYEQTAPEMA